MANQDQERNQSNLYTLAEIPGLDCIYECFQYQDAFELLVCSLGVGAGTNSTGKSSVRNVYYI